MTNLTDAKRRGAREPHPLLEELARAMRDARRAARFDHIDTRRVPVLDLTWGA